MSVCTYIASDTPLQESELLWQLSRGGEDVYTKKQYLAQVDPGLEDMKQLLSYISVHMEKATELEIWYIWQGVESEPVIRSKTVQANELSVKHLSELLSKDVFATTTQYEIPIQYRIIVVK